MSEGKKHYEISFLTKNEKGKEAVMAALNEIEAEITADGKYSEMKLAYPIEKQLSAYFGFVTFMAEPDKIDTLQKGLKFNDDILRILVITPPIKKPSVRGDRRGEENVSTDADNVKEAEKKEAAEEAISEVSVEEPSSPEVQEEPSPKIEKNDKKEEINDELLDQKLEEILK